MSFYNMFWRQCASFGEEELILVHSSSESETYPIQPGLPEILFYLSTCIILLLFSLFFSCRLSFFLMHSHWYVYVCVCIYRERRVFLFRWIRKIFDFALKCALHLIFNQQLFMMNYVLFSATKLLLFGLLQNDLNIFVTVEKRLMTEHELEDILLGPHLKILKKFKTLSMIIHIL